ncbi:hypothetical protein IW150_001257 [Coemansia sp. RSA 2607]|nr:hypothetical protein IW150_001257 [Coemansia sp. RSA 2607]
MSSQPGKQQEKGGSVPKQVEETAPLSGEPVGKAGERVETVAAHEGAPGENQREVGKVVTVERMQKMERRLDDVCALLEALMTGRRVGEGARPVEYTPSPGGALSRFEYHEQPLYGTPGTAVERTWQSEDRGDEKARSNKSDEHSARRAVALAAHGVVVEDLGAAWLEIRDTISDDKGVSGAQDQKGKSVNTESTMRGEERGAYINREDSPSAKESGVNPSEYRDNPYLPQQPLVGASPHSLALGD